MTTHQSPDTDQDHVPPVRANESDYTAARLALSKNWPNLKTEDPEHSSLLQKLAEFHNTIGSDSFQLRFNLRVPRDRTEIWTKQFMDEEIGADELRERFKADAERSLDREMLEVFAKGYQTQVEHYSAILKNAVRRPTDIDPDTVRAKEAAIDYHVAALRGKLPLWKENLATVFEALEEVRITSGRGLIKLGDFEATSAHWLAEIIFGRLTESWKSCREIAERSKQKHVYLYEARAIELFEKVSLNRYPSPQSLSERLREEIILVRYSLQSASVPAHGDAPVVLSQSRRTTIKPPANESMERILVGEMMALAAQAGHIFRPLSNSDWGIDGEIELNDGAHEPTGMRLYLQLKSGDSHLKWRARDGAEVFTVKNDRLLNYWAKQRYPVMLVIRQSSGKIRWMDMSAHLRVHGKASRQIAFQGTEVTFESIQEVAATYLASDQRR